MIVVMMVMTMTIMMMTMTMMIFCTLAINSYFVSPSVYLYNEIFIAITFNKSEILNVVHSTTFLDRFRITQLCARLNSSSQCG